MANVPLQTPRILLDYLNKSIVGLFRLLQQYMVTKATLDIEANDYEKCGMNLVFRAFSHVKPTVDL
jgi:hypothetical protein